MNEIINPYIAGAPVVETSMFFGREDVFGWIERSLAGKYVDHILVLHGQRRVGKTSVLKQIPNFLPDKYIQVFFDLQGRTNTTLDRFLWWLAREIARTLKQERGISLPRPDREAFAADPEYLINEFLPNLRPLLNEHVLLLTFDEFDTLDRSGVQETLAVPLIAYLRRLMEIEWLNFVFSIGSSGDKLENMQASYTDFFKSALYRKISFLTRDDCYRLITKPVEGTIQYDRVAVNRIAEITSGHPYFTQLMCHELFSLCQKTGARVIRAKDVESILEDVIERGTVNLKFVWDEASDLEKWILAGLAQTDGGTTPQALGKLLRGQRVRFSESDLNSAIIHLRDKDVITQDNQFIIHLLRMWLQANRPLDRVREELVEVNPIANRYIEIGEEYREMDQAEQAIESYRQALSVDPVNLKAHSSIGSVHLERGAHQEAAAAFEKALQIDDEDVVCRTGYCDANMALGDQARKDGEVDDAIRYYQKILVINAAHTDARQRLSELYQERAERFLADGQDDEALSAFNRAIGFTPEDDSLTTRYNQILVQKKAKVIGEWLAKADRSLARQRWDEAAEMASEALRFDPENQDLQARLLEVKDAPRQFKIQAYRREAEQSITRGDFDKAISAIETAVLLSPEDGSLADWLESTRNDQLNAQLNLYRDRATRAIKAGNWDAAVAACEAALKHSPEDPGLTQKLADAKATRLQAQLDALRTQAEGAIRAQNWNGAIQAWENAVQLAPDDPTWAASLDKTRTAKRHALLDSAQIQAEEALQQQDWVTAIQAVQGAMELAPEETYWAEKLAEIKAARHKAQLEACRSEAASARSGENWDAAIAVLEKYLELEPGDPKIQAEITEIQTEKRQRQLAALKSQAEDTAARENWEAAIGAWGDYLDLDPEDRAGAEAGLQHAQKYARIAKDYTDAQGALRKKRYGRAIELLQSIIAQDPSYKSTSRLLVEAVEANKAIPLWRKPWVYWGFGSIVIVVLGIFQGPRLWQAITASPEPTPSELSPANEDETTQASMLNAANAFAEPILASIANRMPDFEEDFSTPQDYWREHYFFDGDEVPLSEMVSDGVLRLTDEEPNRWYEFQDHFSGENFILQYDFMSDGTARGTTVYFKIRGSQTDRFYRFSLQVNGYWRIEEDGPEPGEERIQEGNVKLESNRFYTLKLISAGDQFAIYLEDEPLAYFQDSNLTGKENALGAFAAYSYNELQVDIDNIKFWNLDEVRIISSTVTPTPTTTPLPSWVTDFAEPILDSIQERAPDFEDDFSQWQPDWQFNTGQYASGLDGENNAMEISNGVMQMSVEPGWVGFAIQPAMQFNDFIMQVDVNLENLADQNGGAAEIGWRGDQERGDDGMVVFSLHRSGNWLVTYQGDVASDLASGWQSIRFKPGSSEITIISLGTEFAIYLNDTPLTYIDDVGQPPGAEIGLNLWAPPYTNQNTSVIEYDNIKIWNLDGVDFSPQAPTPTSIPTAEPQSFTRSILEHIETQPPTFEDDFSAADMVWGGNSGGYAIYAMVKDGVLIMHDRGSREDSIPDVPGEIFPTNGLLNASNFALQFDFVFETQKPVDSVAVQFRSYELLFNHSGEWTLYKNNGSSQTDMDGGREYLKPSKNTLLIIAHNENLAVYLNGALFYTANDITLDGRENTITVTGEYFSEMDFDNVKFWNLDGVELFTSDTSDQPIESLLYTKQILQGAFTDLDWSTNGLIAAIGNESNAVILDAVTGEITQDFSDLEQIFRTVAWHPNGETLTFGTASGVLRFYLLQNSWQGPWDIYTLSFYGGINDISYTADGDKLAAVSDGEFDEYGGYIGIWDTTDNRHDYIRKRFIHDNAQGVDWMPDGNTFLTVGTGSEGHGIFGIRMSTFDNIYESTQVSEKTILFDISPDGLYLATYTFTRVEILTDFEDLKLSCSHGSKINDIAWSTDSRYLATAGADGDVKIWEIANNDGDKLPDPIETLTVGVEVMAVTWSANGSTLAAGDVDGNIWVWDLDGVDF